MQTTEYYQTPKKSTASFDFPTEIITETEQSEHVVESVSINTKAICGRSHFYPTDRTHVDTTRYNPAEKSLDIAFQKLRRINPADYPEFSILTKLYVDHNELTQLPDPALLPNLEYLTCASNKLTSIPTYPKLKFLNMAENRIRTCQSLAGLGLEQLDCSRNEGLVLEVNLPNCEHLYMEHVGLTSLNLDLLPRLRYLDCSNNDLTQLSGSAPELLELAVSRNSLTAIDSYPRLQVIIADHNRITQLGTFGNLESLTIDHNALVSIAAQPRLTKLFANNNQIESIGPMPQLEIIDLGWNHLRSFTIPSTAEYVTLYFNPITNLDLDSALLTKIKELKINYATYNSIYEKFYDNIQAIDMQTNSDRLLVLLGRMEKDLNISTSITKYIYQQFKKLKFREREREIDRIAASIYTKIYPSSAIVRKSDLESNGEYQKLRSGIEKLYHSALMITLYFNGYYN